MSRELEGKAIEDDILGEYDGRIVEVIKRDHGKVDFKVRLKAHKRSHLVKPETVETDYNLDMSKDVIRINKREGEVIRLKPVSDELNVAKHKDTVHDAIASQLGEVSARRDKKLAEYKRENLKLRRRLEKAEAKKDSDSSSDSSPRKPYKCENDHKYTEKAAEKNQFLCPDCGETLVRQDQ